MSLIVREEKVKTKILLLWRIIEMVSISEYNEV